MRTIRGSCLCQAVIYEATLPFDRFLYCHCGRCRKATGSAHAANAYVKPDSFRWVRGEDKVRRFDLPEAHSFSTGFCVDCGTPLPHATRSGREIIIPAGSLDADPGVKPTVRYFSDSQAPWAVPANNLMNAK